MNENEDKQPTEVESTSSTHLDSYLYYSAGWALRKARKAKWPGTRKNACIAVGLFCAFTLEAYLNRLGPKLYGDDWNLWERATTPEAKLALLVRQLRARLKQIGVGLELKIDYGARPFQTFKELFKFRNFIAHGKVIIRKKKVIQQLAEGEQPTAVDWDEWGTEYTVERAKRWKKDTKAIAGMLQYAYERVFFDDEDLADYPDQKKKNPFTLMGGGSTHRITPENRNAT